MMMILSGLLLLLCNTVVLASDIALLNFRCDRDLPFVLKSAFVNCDGENGCEEGDKASIEGKFALSETLNTPNLTISSKITKFFYPLATLNEDDMINLCEGTSNKTDSVCPEVGTYSFTTSITLPPLNPMFLGSTMNTHVILKDDQMNLVGDCQASFASRHGYDETSGYSSNASKYTVTLCGVIIFGALIRNRYQKVKTPAEVDALRFQMMVDPVEVSRRSSGASVFV